MLLDYGCVKADHDSVEAYLEASPVAAGLYESREFVEVGRTDTFIENDRVAGEWYMNLYMIRKPVLKEIMN